VTTNGRFVAQLFGASAGLVALAAFPIWKLYGDRALLGLVAGATVSAANCAGGYWLLRSAVGRSATLETAALLGGFLGRLAVAIAMLLLCRRVAAIDVTAMGLSLVAFYFVTMLVEIRFLFKNVLGIRPPLKGAVHRVTA
jgi:hypothetical protein